MQTFEIGRVIRSILSSLGESSDQDFRVWVGHPSRLSRLGESCDEDFRGWVGHPSRLSKLGESSEEDFRGWVGHQSRLSILGESSDADVRGWVEPGRPVDTDSHKVEGRHQGPIYPRIYIYMYTGRPIKGFTRRP